ncbi:MAG: hypothetical protein D6733_00585 [Methanobacteriota archaeon]|nr:MAG: hypothetical protein D6733_00585 [Euryarchaeota archaeon]
MEFIYVLVISAAITGGIVYGVGRFSRGRRRPSKKSLLDGLDLEIDEDFLEDVDSGFEGRVYRKAAETEARESKPAGKVSEYPPCFGTADAYSTCKRDCSVLDECASTIKILEGL